MNSKFSKQDEGERNGVGIGKEFWLVFSVLFWESLYLGESKNVLARG